MNKIIDLHYNFYANLKSNLEVKDILEYEKITILDGFNKNIELVHRYYQKVYSLETKRVVLSGIRGWQDWHTIS